MPWFKRKVKNRRLNREEVLDVKLRSDQVRAHRVRLLSLTLCVSFGTLLGLFIAWRAGQWALDKLVFENSAFAIRNVEVQTDGMIRLEQLRRWAGIKPGQNLLALDLGRVKRDLELCSAIHSAAIERVLPNTLRIRVLEREPIARVHAMMPRADGKGITPVLYHVDALGNVFVPLDKSLVNLPPDASELPLLVGASQADVRPGRRAESPQVQAALTLLCEFDHSPMAGLVSLKQIDCSPVDVLSVLTGQGSEVTFSLRQIDRQFRQWRSLYDVGVRQNRAIATLDLSVGDNIPARWLETAPVPPPARPKPTARTKKKNV